MASGTTQNTAPQSAAGRMVAYDRFIEEQLRKTAGDVKSVDIIGGLLTMASAGVGLLLLAALVDHWVARGGMGMPGRFLFFLVIFGAGIYYFVRQVLPSMIWRINPVYSAYTIERSTPSLKNSLLNFLLLRGEREHVPEVVFNTIEEQAARRLSGVTVETVVDRSRILRVGYVLVTLVVIFALYKIFSPKDPLKTASRVLLPWANITAPSRVVIERVTPGDHTAMRGEQVTIEATVRGLREEERVVVTYSSADGQMVDQTVGLARHGETDTYRGKIPESDAGVHAAIEYRVTAGDAASPLFHIDVVAAPTIIVEGIDYEYPAYTGLSNRSTVHEGDIHAIEGTKVTIRGRANQPIKSAWIDLDNDGRTDVKMRPQDDQATASFVLALDEDRHGAKHPRYSLRFANTADQRNRSPVEHSIEVIPDLAPEVVILQPHEQQIELPLDGELLIEVQALDPDFVLRSVALRGQVAHREVFHQSLLDEPRSGQLVGKYRLVPADQQLQVGEVVEFWGIAEDNRAPKPNHAETEHYRVKIVAPEQDSPRREKNPRQGTDEPNDDEPQISLDDNDQPAHDKSAKKSKQNGEKRQNPQGKDPNQQDSTNRDRDDQQQADADQRDPNDHSDEPRRDKKQRPDKQDKREKQEQPNDNQSQSSDDKDSQGNDGTEGQGSKSGEGKQKQGKQGREKKSTGSNKKQSGSDQGDGEGNGAEQSSGGKAGKNAEHKGTENSGRNSDSGQEPGEPSDAHDRTNKRGGEAGHDAARDNVSNDGSDDGAAFEEALKRIQQGDGKQSGQSRPTEKQNTGEKDASEQNPAQKQEPGDGAGQKSQPSGGQNSEQGAKQPTGQKPNESSDPSGNQQPGEKANQQPGSGKSGQKQSGQKPTDGGQPGEKSPDDKQSGDKRPGEKGSPDNQQGDQQLGEENSGKPDAQKQPSGEKQGAGKQPTKKPSGEDGATSDKGQDKGQEQPGDQPESKGSGSKKPGQQSGADDKQPKPDGGGDQPMGDGGQQPQPKEKPAQSPQKKSGEDEGSGEQAGGDKGQGAQSKGGDSKQNQQQKKPSDSKQQRPDAKGGDGQNDKGEPGAGKEGKDDAGSPDPQTDIAQNNNKQQKPNGESTSKEQGKSPAHGKRESNSDGSQGGDKSGGGEEGGGQQAPQRGTGSAGQNTSADEGNGQSSESGEGDTSDKPGNDVQSKDGSGKASQKPGGQSQSKPSGNGKSGGQSSGKPSEGQSPAPKGGAGKQSSDPSQRGGQQGGGGLNSGGEVKGGEHGHGEAQEAAPGDAANLDYARKATDLVLESLDKQLRDGKVDQELLDRLGWSKEDLAKFVERWKKLKQDAQGQGDKATRARDDLDESLRSLGLGKRRVQRAAGAASDEQNQLREGMRTSAPAEYADQVNAYKKGLSSVKGKRDGR